MIFSPCLTDFLSFRLSGIYFSSVGQYYARTGAQIDSLFVKIIKESGNVSPGFPLLLYLMTHLVTNLEDILTTSIMTIRYLTKD